MAAVVALPAAGGPRPVPSPRAARGAHALLRLAPPGTRAASLMPFSGEERSLQGIYKPAGPAEGRGAAGTAVCTECYTNRSFVYDDGSAHRYPPAGRGARSVGVGVGWGDPHRGLPLPPSWGAAGPAGARSPFPSAPPPRPPRG